jgi:hypothetical protein
MSHTCGECSLCCKLLSIAQLRKPIDTWCRHCAPGAGGCLIYAERPFTCVMFECGWLKWPVHWPGGSTPSPTFTEEWFPARCHFVLSYDDLMCPLVVVDPGYPLAWRSEPFYSAFCAIADHEFSPGMRVPLTVRIGPKLIRLGPAGAERHEHRSARRIKREFQERCAVADEEHILADVKISPRHRRPRFAPNAYPLKGDQQ